MKKLLLVLMVVLVGCSTTNKNDINYSDLSSIEICISADPEEIAVANALSSILGDHGLTSKLYDPDDETIADCEYIVSYRAERTDVIYLSYAVINVMYGGAVPYVGVYNKHSSNVRYVMEDYIKLRPVVKELINKIKGNNNDE